MRFQNSAGRFFRPAARDILAVACRIRQWRIAGEKLTTAEDLMVELDRVADRHPTYVRRVECLRSALMASILDSVISIPTEVPV